MLGVAPPSRLRKHLTFPLYLRIVVEWLPAYAPELNPVQPVWSHSKYGDLADFTPDSLPALESAVVSSLLHSRSQRALLAAFVRAARLEL